MKDQTTMTTRERREARLYSAISITMDTDKVRETVDNLDTKADAIKSAETVRSAKTRITKIEKEIQAVIPIITRIENRVEKNGGIFPLTEGVRMDFDRIIKTVNREKNTTSKPAAGCKNPASHISNEKETHDEHRIINEVKASGEGTRDAGCGVHPKGDSRGNGTEVSHSRAVFQQPRETDCNRRNATPDVDTPSGDRQLGRGGEATWHDAASDTILARDR